MKKIISVIFVLLSIYSYSISINWSIEEIYSYSRELEDVEYQVKAEIVDGFKTLAVIKTEIKPFSDYNLSSEGKGFDYSSDIELVVNQTTASFGEKTKKYYTAELRKNYKTLVKKDFTFYLTADGINVVDGHRYY